MHIIHDHINKAARSKTDLLNSTRAARALGSLTTSLTLPALSIS